MKAASAIAIENFSIDGYSILEPIGEGASSTVYRGALLKDPSKVVAIKISKQEWNPENIESRIRFENEAELLFKLSHPNIIKLIKYGFSANHPYLITEFAGGESLSKRKWDFNQIVEILRQLATALAHAHAKNVLHRDINPANVLVTFADKITVKILDFGLGAGDGAAVAGVGTLLYVSPEQLGVLPQAPDERSDLYSLGMVAVELICGKHPFAKMEMRDVIDAQANVVPRLPDGVPTMLARIVDLLIKKDPDQRYATAKGVATDLQMLQESLSKGAAAAFELRTQDRNHNLNPPKFMGRSKERETLVQAYEGSKRSRTQLVSIAAHSGMGKTRLISEVVRKWSKSHILWGVGRAYSQAGAYGLFAEALRDLTTERQSASTITDIKVALGDLAGEIVSLVPEFKALLGETQPAPKILPERRQQRFFAVMTSLLKALGKPETPLVLILDDLQWADEGSLQLILHLARLKESPLFMILSYRAEEVVDGNRTHQFLESLKSVVSWNAIELAPLTKDDMSSLVFSMLGKQIPQVEDLIFKQANGSPLFAVELLHALTESNALIPSDAGWVLHDLEKIKHLALTDNLANTIVRRLERLSPEHLTVMKVAAVVGRNFTFDVLYSALATLVDDDREKRARRVMEALREGEEARLVGELSESEGYTFTHDKIREGLYDRLSVSERQKFHSLVGLALETASQSSSEKSYALAHHFLNSADKLKAMLYATKAGDLATRQNANREAIDFYSKARLIASELQVDESQMAYLNENLADCYTMLGDFERAITSYNLVLQQAPSEMDKSRILGKFCRAAFSKGDVAEAIRASDRALEYLGVKIPTSKLGKLFGLIQQLVIVMKHTYFPPRRAPSKDPKHRVIAGLLGEAAWTRYFTDSQIALYLHFRHMNLAERHNIVPEMIAAYSMHGPAMTVVPNFPRGIRYCRRGLALALEADDRWAGASARTRLFLVLASSAQSAEALEEAKLAESEFQKLGDRWDLLNLLVNVANLYAYLGDWDLAEQYIAKVQILATEVDNKAGITQAAVSRSWICARLDCNELLAQLESVLPDTLKGHDKNAICQGLAAKGRVLLRLGRFAEAILAYETASEVAIKNKLRAPYVVGTFPGKVEALLQGYLNTSDAAEKARYLKLADFESSRAFKRLRKFPNYTAMAARARARVMFYKNKRRAAEKLWRLCLASTTEQGHKYQRALTLKEWGMCIYSSNKPLAEKLLAQAYRIFLELRATLDSDEINDLVPRTLRGEETLTRAGPGFTMLNSSPGSVSRSRSNKTSVSTQRELDALLSVGLASVASSDPKDQVRFILDEVIKLLAADRAFLFSQDRTTNKLEPLAGRSSINQDLPELKGFSSTIVNKVFQSGEPLIMTGTDRGEANMSQSVVLSEVRSIIAAPLKLRDVVTGVVYMDSKISDGLFSNEDLDVLAAICTHIAITLEATQMAGLEAQRREMAKDLELSAFVQRLFLPSNPSCISTQWDLRGFNQPATQCGGDWWWYSADRPNKLWLIVGDVTGHGAAPAMVTASVASLVKSLTDASTMATMPDVLNNASRSLNEIVKSEYLMSAVGLEYEANRLKVWYAAFPPIYILRQDGKIEGRVKPGSHLGSASLELGYEEITINKGDRLFICTDGIVEMETDKGTMLGEGALIRMLKKQRSLKTADAIRNLNEELHQARGTMPIQDDITMVMIDFL